MTCAPSRVPKPRHWFAVTNVHGFRDFFQRSSALERPFPERRSRISPTRATTPTEPLGVGRLKRATDSVKTTREEEDTQGRKRVRRRVFITERRFCHTASSRVVSGCATATPASPLVSLRLRPAFLRRGRERRRTFLPRRLRFFRRLRLRLARFLASAGAAAWVRIRPGGVR